MRPLEGEGKRRKERKRESELTRRSQGDQAVVAQVVPVKDDEDAVIVVDHAFVLRPPSGELQEEGLVVWGRAGERKGGWEGGRGRG